MATNEMENTVENTTPEAPKAPAKKAPAKRTTRKPSARTNGRKPAAKKAPAKKAPAKKTEPTGRKVRWTVVQAFANGKNQTGVGLGGTKYDLVRANDGEYAARVTTPKGVKTDLVKGSFSAAYWAAVNHNKAAVERADAAAAKRAGKKAESEAA